MDEEKKDINEEHKDRLFKFIFGNPEHKAWTLDLYNAVNGSSYTDPEDIQITTIDDVVYMKMKNDVSFLIDNIMSFYEAQSTFNPNMPMRFLIYAGMVYSKLILEDFDFNLYSYKQQKAPTPRCVCFYNGIPNKPDEMLLYLKDSFEPDSDPDIEVKVRMININYGHNKELMEACRPIKDYAFFIDRIRSYRKNDYSMEQAVDSALEDMPEDSVIKPFLIRNKAEVRRMCLTEYNEERTLAQTRKEAFTDGREEGIEIGALRILIGLVKDGILSLAEAAARAQMSVEEFESKAAAIAAL